MELNGVRVSRETQERLQHFAQLFQKWAKTINLVAPSTVDDLWRRHIADSAQIFQLHPVPSHWVDLGSGGGFPGVITAILLAETGAGHVDLIESNQKKAAFLRVCLRECEARGAVHAVRIENAPTVAQHCDAISARALAELELLLDYAAPWRERNENLRLFLHKGRDYERELEKARGRWEFDLVKHRSVVEQDSVILELSRLRCVN
ncbi:16S rRNA (guanine(527)-N(7))-methyltransferase RsmG [Rhizobium sp. P40RR-XXII]|uniref:16S rRNA (guanine(527)-N(7))-methyltransferase RsmG n=1 Tax=unclassified Rhizobium TaxID=2613769 RepID=UPI001456437F|nr:MULTISPECIES: 16S rRNA (guanine(527)-N(7))-methyltransferase RsmG [unclassified Rhizobium]NLR88111.1 16S rRNA (guanine(527)-N(7))-methyltransferase RsmG [Rhizobium sp. P28RR-XV]NLS18989.1 16S rRNA (guanine(527)-N(7))-methyltransferase RsmG [Rhizobium sp. P40RR-XXII]